ncbi:MAG: 3-hydroxyacyl-ACP dehydratase FabZ family protein [Thermoguttaceae bacterium]
MRFTLIDRILELQPGSQITAVKSLTMAEEYLADHFPNFPVIPGVLMLEALTQSAAWLIRRSEDFAHSMVVLKQANNVKYAHFLEPGQTLVIQAEILSQDEGETRLKAQGTVDGRPTVSARLTLARYNLADANHADAALDEALRQQLRKLFGVLYQVRRVPGPGPGVERAATVGEHSSHAI